MKTNLKRILSAMLFACVAATNLYASSVVPHDRTPAALMPVFGMPPAPEAKIIVPYLPVAEVKPAVPVADAFKSFKEMSRAEKKSRIKEVKSAIKDFKENKKSGKASENTLLLVIVAILLPPLAVYLHEGEINKKFWIDLLLTLLFYLPGLIYALVLILKKN
jgi:uncharacterized membrane protein YqaE (UPF0057 family)